MPPLYSCSSRPPPPSPLISSSSSCSNSSSTSSYSSSVLSSPGLLLPVAPDSPEASQQTTNALDLRTVELLCPTVLPFVHLCLQSYWTRLFRQLFHKQAKVEPTHPSKTKFRSWISCTYVLLISSFQKTLLFDQLYSAWKAVVYVWNEKKYWSVQNGSPL